MVVQLKEQIAPFVIGVHCTNHHYHEFFSFVELNKHPFISMLQFFQCLRNKNSNHIKHHIHLISKSYLNSIHYLGTTQILPMIVVKSFLPCMCLFDMSNMKINLNQVKTTKLSNKILTCIWHWKFLLMHRFNHMKY